MLKINLNYDFKIIGIFILIIFNTTLPILGQKTVRYDLYVKDTIVNYSGKSKPAFAVNGQIPMPTLVFTEGDTAEIHVHNLLKTETSLHWHGLFLPNKEDGVPFVTQMPIPPHATHIYKFPIIQNGTHWYHSHTKLQEQLGMYGLFICLKKNNDPKFRTHIDNLPYIPVILSDWTDLSPYKVNRLLHFNSDFFAIKKNTVQSYAEAARAGFLSTKFLNEWKRMDAMDVNDVYYDKVLLNGKQQTQISSIQGSNFKTGDKLRLRIANGGAASYFWINYSGGKFLVVAADGNDVEPVEVDRLLMGNGETYDIIIKIPSQDSSYEILASSEDRSGASSLIIGNGNLKKQEPLPPLKFFQGMKMMNVMMKINGNVNIMAMQKMMANMMQKNNSLELMTMNNATHNNHNQTGMNLNMQNDHIPTNKSTMNQHDMNVLMYPEITGFSNSKKNQNTPHLQHNSLTKIVTLNYAMLKSTTNTELPSNAPIKELHFTLEGNMFRYVWSLDNKVLSETDKILIKKGEIVRIKIFNNSMMRHPMHLHGHDFRILNGQGDYAPLKNTIDVLPGQTQIIEFNANAEGDWFFHCHILYHLNSGMARIFSYQNQATNPLIPNPKLAQRKLFSDDRTFYFNFENDFVTNSNDGALMFQNTRWSIGTEWRIGYNDIQGYESETHIGRYFGKMQWLMPFIGFDWRYRKPQLDVNGNLKNDKNLFGQTNTKDNRRSLSIGLEYTLPMLVIIQGELFMNGNLRFQLMRDGIPITKRLRGDFSVNTDKEFTVRLHYILGKNIGLSSLYDSDLGFGIGFYINH
ncbi:MAG: multicopper oxidase family protein [Limnohabitans sp.]|nr:multicopper oxidase family protein [Limnohabitans sp.]